MIKVISRAAVATAIRAAMTNARIFLSDSNRENLEVHLMDNLNRLSVEVESPQMVSKERYNLLEMKYNTLLALEEYRNNAELRRKAETEAGSGRRVDIPKASRPERA